MKLSVLIASLLYPLCSMNAVAQVAAENAAWLVDSSGCKFLNPMKGATSLSFRWDGKCVDGFVSGPGELRIEGRPMIYRGDFANGLIVSGSVQTAMVIYQGEFLDNAPHGRGTIQLPDGRIGSGTFEQGLPMGHGFEMTWSNGSRYAGDVDPKRFDMEGTGTLTYSDGSNYEGEFRGGRLQGNGVMKYANGAISRGVFVDGQLHGKGSIHYSNGNDYEGELRIGKPDGQGRMTFANGGFYEGAFADGTYQGKGKMTYGTGDVYEGDFLAGETHGTGLYRYVTGDVYEGQYVSGKRHGTGRLTFAIGDIWEGEWKQGMMYGKCRKSSARGSVYDGQCASDRATGTGHFEDRVTQTTYDGGFRDNLYDGEGHLRTPDSEYKGTFKQGLKDGAGKLTETNGTEYEGAFARDVMHGQGVLRTKDRSGTKVLYEGEFVLGRMEGAGTLQVGPTQFKGVFKNGMFNRRRTSRSKRFRRMLHRAHRPLRPRFGAVRRTGMRRPIDFGTVRRFACKGESLCQSES